MPRLLRSAQSRLDYNEIWDFVGADNPDAADALIRLFDEHLDLLAASPHLGRDRPELFGRLRSFPVGNYLIFYRPLKDGIELIRVLHGARDIRPDVF